MTTDRELLEGAARAAGIAIYFDDDGDCYRVKASENRCYWNPLLFDGDALRLAVKLKLNVMQGDFSCEVNDEREICIGFLHQEVENSPYAATRRAIVNAAYEIGREKV